MDWVEKCKSNWKKILVCDNLDLNDADIKSKLSELDFDVNKNWRVLNKNRRSGNNIALFRDTPIEETIEMSNEYITLYGLAKGFAQKGCAYYGNQKLLDDILWALEWGYNHYYGQAEIEERGWRSYFQFNWHDWHIKTPSAIMDTILLLDDYIPLEKKKAYISLFDFIRNKPDDFTSNKVNFGRLIICSGILTENSERLLCGRDGIADTYYYADDGKTAGQGFYKDGSYIFHMHHPQNALYGNAHIAAAVKISEILNGTEYDAAEYTDKLFDWYDNSFKPFLYKGNFMGCVCGREIDREKETGNILLRTALHIYKIGNQARKDGILDSFEDCFGRTEISGSDLPLTEYIIYNDILKQLEKRNRALKPNRLYAFNCEDRAVYRNGDTAVSLAMHSSRIYDYESINSLNLSGWHHSSGMLNVYTYPNHYDDAYWNNVNHYRIPGTTVDAGERQKISVAQGNEFLSDRDFVGTLSCGQTGLSVMSSVGYNSEGKLICDRYYTPDGKYGSAPEKHTSTFSANVAWFFLSQSIVCMGNGISSNDDLDVYTVLENRKTKEINVNGKPFTPKVHDETVEKVEYFSVDGITYYLYSPKNLIINQNNSDAVFTEVLLNYGKNPINESYVYAFSTQSNNSTENFEAFSSAEILSNGSYVQAVRDLSNGNVYYAFWKAGEFNGIKVRKPLLIAVCGDVIYACDITQKLHNEKIMIDGKQYNVDFTNRFGKCVKIGRDN